MKSVHILAVALAVTVLAAGFVSAGPRGFGTGGCPGAGACQIELTEEQQKKAAELRLSYLKKAEAIDSELSKKRLELIEMASKDEPDFKAIEKKREEMWSLRDKLTKERREAAKQFRSLLTPEQLKTACPFVTGGGCGFGGRGAGWGPGCAGFGGGYGFRKGCAGRGGPKAFRGGRGCGGCPGAI